MKLHKNHLKPFKRAAFCVRFPWIPSSFEVKSGELPLREGIKAGSFESQLLGAQELIADADAAGRARPTHVVASGVAAFSRAIRTFFFVPCSSFSMLFSAVFIIFDPVLLTCF